MILQTVTSAYFVFSIASCFYSQRQHYLSKRRHLRVHLHVLQNAV